MQSPFDFEPVSTERKMEPLLPLSAVGLRAQTIHTLHCPPLLHICALYNSESPASYINLSLRLISFLAARASATAPPALVPPANTLLFSNARRSR